LTSAIEQDLPAVGSKNLGIKDTSVLLPTAWANKSDRLTGFDLKFDGRPELLSFG